MEVLPWHIDTKAIADRKGIFLLVAYVIIFFSYLALELSGHVSHVSRLSFPLAVFGFIVMGAALWYRPLIRERFDHQLAVIRPYSHIAFIFIAFYLVEQPYNAFLFEMPFEYMLINICIIAALYGIVYHIGQRNKVVIAVFLVVCFFVGVANYFVITFKGQPILPSDLFALSTAASVSGGYTYIIDDKVLVSLMVFLAACLFLSLLPRVKATRSLLAVNVACASVLVVGFGYWFANYDIEESYGCTVDVWSAQDSYASQGSALCFLKRAQELSLDPPIDFSAEKVESALAFHAGLFGDAAASEKQPAVVVVMNETFADLSAFESIDESYGGPAFYNSISDAVMKGNAYVSALGGGTCNSEFELLTGSSMANLGKGVYPYVLYDLSSSGSLAKQFAEFGYETTAIHPAEATNWRRDIVYKQLGFEKFIDIEAFSESDTLRDLTTDKATYDLVLDILENDPDPQFIFNVTIQNHSGYDTGLIPESMPLSFVEAAIGNEEIVEYLACIQQADADLEYFIRALSEIDRPVVLCFFGDHQPSLSDAISEESFAKEVNDFTIDEVQARYTVPYMIWANYETGYSDKPSYRSLVSGLELNWSAGAEGAASLWDLDGIGFGDGAAERVDTADPFEAIDELVDLPGFIENPLSDEAVASPSADLSLNYLGANLVNIADLPLTDYQKYLLGIQAFMPALNLNGYMDASNTWYWLHEDSAVRPILDEYAVLQYANLFGTQ